MAERRTFLVRVVCEHALTVEQVWPDGNAPANPTAEDVAEVISDCVYSPGELLDEWSLKADVDVDGIDVVF